MVVEQHSLIFSSKISHLAPRQANQELLRSLGVLRDKRQQIELRRQDTIVEIRSKAKSTREESSSSHDAEQDEWLRNSAKMDEDLLQCADDVLSQGESLYAESLANGSIIGQPLS